MSRLDKMKKYVKANITRLKHRMFRVGLRRAASVQASGGASARATSVRASAISSNWLFSTIEESSTRSATPSKPFISIIEVGPRD